jgi:hypothetical protein
LQLLPHLHTWWPGVIFKKIMRTPPHINNIILGPYIREITKGEAIPVQSQVWSESEDSRGRDSHISTQSEHEGDKFVRPTH